MSSVHLHLQGSNPSINRPVQHRSGVLPGGEDYQIDFTQLPLCRGLKYLLVYSDTFTGWTEAFPIRTLVKAQEVAKAVLKEIIPRFGLPRSLQGITDLLLFHK